MQKKGRNVKKQKMHIRLYFRPIFTSLFSLTNRRILDLDDEWKNIRLKNAEDSEEKIFNQISDGLRRITKEIFTKKDEIFDSENEDSDADENGSHGAEKNKELFRRRLYRHSFERSTRWFKG